MRAACSDLTYITIPSGHWLTHEQPAAVSAAIARWLATRLASFVSAGGTKDDQND